MYSIEQLGSVLDSGYQSDNLFGDSLNYSPCDFLYDI